MSAMMVPMKSKLCLHGFTSELFVFDLHEGRVRSALSAAEVVVCRVFQDSVMQAPIRISLIILATIASSPRKAVTEKQKG